MLGNHEQSLGWARRALEMDPTDSGVLYNVACAYSLLGKPQEAITCLEQAIANGFGHKAWLEHDADLNSLRSEARFQTLLQKM